MTLRAEVERLSADRPPTGAECHAWVRSGEGSVAAAAYGDSYERQWITLADVYGEALLAAGVPDDASFVAHGCRLAPASRRLVEHVPISEAFGRTASVNDGWGGLEYLTVARIRRDGRGWAWADGPTGMWRYGDTVAVLPEGSEG